MAYSLTQKVIVSGQTVEFVSYQKPTWRGYEVEREREPKQLDVFEELKRKELNKKLAYNRSRTQIKRLVNSNVQWKDFFTLTFAANITDKKRANYLFNIFIQKLKYYKPDFSYLCVPERQQRGAVHYHIICNMGYIDFNWLRELWGHGRIEVKEIKSKKKVGAYISKYLTKSASEFSKKSYFCSQDIFRPIELIGFYAERFVASILLWITPIFETKFLSEWTGVVNYKEYLLDFRPFPTGFYVRQFSCS